jgi:hypothetical protein
MLQEYETRPTPNFGLTFFDGLGMNCEAENLREALLHAVFEGRGDVVDLGDGQSAVHGAVARDENFVVHASHVNFVAIRHFVIFRL